MLFLKHSELPLFKPCWKKKKQTVSWPVGKVNQQVIPQTEECIYFSLLVSHPQASGQLEPPSRTRQEFQRRFILRDIYVNWITPTSRHVVRAPAHHWLRRRDLKGLKKLSGPADAAVQTSPGSSPAGGSEKTGGGVVSRRPEVEAV